MNQDQLFCTIEMVYILIQNPATFPMDYQEHQLHHYHIIKIFVMIMNDYDDNSLYAAVLTAECQPWEAIVVNVICDHLINPIQFQW